MTSSSESIDAAAPSDGQIESETAASSDQSSESQDSTSTGALTEMEDESEGPEDELTDDRRAASHRRYLQWLAPRKNKWRVLAVAAIAVLLIGGGGGYVWMRSGELPNGVAFRVGNRDVTAQQLDAKAGTLHALYGVQPPKDKNKIGGFHRAIAKAEALNVILDDQASQRHIVIPSKTAHDVLTRYIQQQAGGDPDAQDKFVQALGNVGTSEPAVIHEIQHMLAVNQLFNQTTQGTSVSDGEVRQAFTQRQTQLGSPEQRGIKNIVVDSPEKANDVMQQVQNGAPFEDVAKQASLDSKTRDSGGDLGDVAASQLDDNYAKTAFRTPEKGLFGPVQTQSGWNIGKIVSIKPPQIPDFVSVKDKLKQQLVFEKSMKKWQQWLGQEVKDAHVQYADAYQPPNPDSPPPGHPGQPAVQPNAAPSSG